MFIYVDDMFSSATTLIILLCIPPISFMLYISLMMDCHPAFLSSYWFVWALGAGLTELYCGCLLERVGGEKHPLAVPLRKAVLSLLTIHQQPLASQTAMVPLSSLSTIHSRMSTGPVLLWPHLTWLYEWNSRVMSCQGAPAHPLPLTLFLLLVLPWCSLKHRCMCPV